MISYKYKLYQTKRLKHIEKMLDEACFVWNHILAIQKRYYRIYHKYANVNILKKHFPKWYKIQFLHSQTVQEIIERLDISYMRFFNRLSTRPPKFRKSKDFSSIVFKQGGYSIYDNIFTINKIHKNYKFSNFRSYEGNIKRLIIKRNQLGEFFIIAETDSDTKKYGKTLKGASVGIDFGLKTYLTLSDGTRYENPLFLKQNLTKLRKLSQNLSKCQKGSNNQKKKVKELNRFYDNIKNKRDDFQWKLAHEICRKYDRIFIEDLNLKGMIRRWGRKMNDQSHYTFIQKLEYISTKYGVLLHKIDRFYPSSKTCTCGYINSELKLSDRQWTCPLCGTTHDRDLLAANNILRQGIAELESDCKTFKQRKKGYHVCIQQSRPKRGTRVCHG